MSPSATPSDIARETIRQLAARRIAPTPDSYAAVYAEIAGHSDRGAAGLAALRVLERAADELARRGAAGGAELQRAVGQQNWAAVESVLRQGPLAPSGAESEREPWGDLIRQVLHQLEARHAGITAARKREALEHVLGAFGHDPAKLAARLGKLVRSWGEGTAAAPVALSGPIAVRPEAEDLAMPLRDLLAETLRAAVAHGLLGEATLTAEAQALADRVGAARTAREVAGIAKALRALLLRVELGGESPAALAQSLKSLLGLVTENLGSLVENDAWLSGQLAAVRQVLERPLARRSVLDAERALRGVLYRQTLAKHSLDRARDTFKTMLATFVERLESMGAAASGHHDRVRDYGRRIAAARDLSELSEVLAGLEETVRAVQTDLARGRDELERARAEAAESVARVHALEHELAETSALVREDVLTTALNRRGLSEAYAVEAARSEREGTPLAVALLDVDNFKQFNDGLGHAAGDDALRHLATVMRQTLRPTDSVARYGGEEFVVLLPNSGLEEACAVMTRVQRELTRRIFMHNHERVLITFSAGVTVRAAGELEAAALARADAALLRAKRDGKNRVVPG